MQNSHPPARKMSKGYLIIFLLIAAFIGGFLYAAGIFGGKATSAQQFIDLQEPDPPHLGFRRAHAKGICIQGTLESTGLLAPFTEAEFFQAQEKHPFIGRFSIAGVNPLAPDLAAPVRSMALSFASSSGQRWRTAMNTPTVMPVGTPEDLYQQFKVLTPTPDTGKPDPDKARAFFDAHPETAAFNDWKQHYRPTNSFATEQYNSINAFYLIDNQGQRRAVRWAMVPQAKVSNMPSAIEDAPNALQLELAQRLQQAPVQFDLMVSFATDQDDEADPTIPWPDSRKTINVATLVINEISAQKNGACNGINFDPLVLPQGMSLTADPILNARSGAYAESYRRRARETFFESSIKEPKNE